MGPAILAFLLLQSVYRLAWLGLPRYRAGIARTGRFLDMALIPLMALLLVNWIPTLIEVLGEAV
jgi:hypothetical protein